VRQLSLTLLISQGMTSDTPHKTEVLIADDFLSIHF